MVKETKPEASPERFFLLRNFKENNIKIFIMTSAWPHTSSISGERSSLHRWLYVQKPSRDSLAR